MFRASLTRRLFSTTSSALLRQQMQQLGFSEIQHKAFIELLNQYHISVKPDLRELAHDLKAKVSVHGLSCPRSVNKETVWKCAEIMGFDKASTVSFEKHSYDLLVPVHTRINYNLLQEQLLTLPVPRRIIGVFNASHHAVETQMSSFALTMGHINLQSQKRVGLMSGHESLVVKPSPDLSPAVQEVDIANKISAHLNRVSDFPEEDKPAADKITLSRLTAVYLDQPRASYLQTPYLNVLQRLRPRMQVGFVTAGISNEFINHCLANMLGIVEVAAHQHEASCAPRPGQR